MSSPYESRSSVAIGRKALRQSVFTWPISNKYQPYMEIISGEFFQREGLDVDAAGEGRAERSNQIATPQTA